MFIKVNLTESVTHSALDYLMISKDAIYINTDLITTIIPLEDECDYNNDDLSGFYRVKFSNLDRFSIYSHKIIDKLITE